MPQRELEVALAEVLCALDAQAPEVRAFPLGGPLSRDRGHQAGQLSGRGRGRIDRFPAQQRMQVISAAAQPGQLGLIEFTLRSDHALTWVYAAEPKMRSWVRFSCGSEAGSARGAGFSTAAQFKRATGRRGCSRF